MRLLLSGGIFSWLVFLWGVISFVIAIIMYKRCPKHVFLMLGTLLGSILFAFGATGLFSGLSRTLRTLAITSVPDIKSLVLEGINRAKIPFSIGTLMTIIYFAFLCFLIIMKKGIIKKWSLWVGWGTLLFFTLLLSTVKHSLNVNLIKGFVKIVTTGDTIPETLYPFIGAGRMSILTSVCFSLVYLFVIILFTIRKVRQKPVI